MKFLKPIPVRKLAEQLGAQLLGDTQLQATGINEIHHVQPGDITFVDVAKYFDRALHSAASVILVNEAVDPPPGKALLVVAQPFEAYNRLVMKRRPRPHMIGAVDPTAEIGAFTVIETGVVIGPHVIIGSHCHLQANVVIHEHCIIGNDVLIESGTVVGSDAFYYKRTPDGWRKWRAGGRVVIGHQVDIGALCTINRGVSSDTVIGAGSKLDCQVQIGHDTKLGERCLLAAQVGIAGNCTLGNDVILQGQVGVAQNITIGDGAVVLAQSGVSKDLPGGQTYFGSPAREARLAYRELATLRRLTND